MKQHYDEGKMNEIEFGGYVGWFGRRINVRANASVAVEMFETQRNIELISGKPSSKAEFNTYSARGGIETELVIPTVFRIIFKPFIGFEGGYVKNEEINEYNDGAVNSGVANLKIEAGNYSRFATIFGARIGVDKEGYSWDAKVYGQYLHLGNKPQYEMSLQAATALGLNRAMGIWGSRPDEKTGIVWRIRA